MSSPPSSRRIPSRDRTSPSPWFGRRGAGWASLFLAAACLVPALGCRPQPPPRPVSRTPTTAEPLKDREVEAEPTAEALLAKSVALLRSMRRMDVSIEAEKSWFGAVRPETQSIEMQWTPPDHLRVASDDAVPFVLSADGEQTALLLSREERYIERPPAPLDKDGFGRLKALESPEFLSVCPTARFLLMMPLDPRTQALFEPGADGIVPVDEAASALGLEAPKESAPAEPATDAAKPAGTGVAGAKPAVRLPGGAAPWSPVQWKLIGKDDLPEKAYHLRCELPIGRLHWFVASRGRPFVLRAQLELIGAALPLNSQRPPGPADLWLRLTETYRYDSVAFGAKDVDYSFAARETEWAPLPRMRSTDSILELAQPRHSKLPQAVGLLAPPLVLKTSTGGSFQLDAWKGRQHVVLFFFSPLAPGSVEVLKRMEAQASRWLTRGASFFPVAVGLPLDKAGAFRQASGVQSNFLVDPQGQAARALRVGVLPAVWVVDRNGWVFRIHEALTPEWDAVVSQEVDALVHLETRRAEVLASLDFASDVNELVEALNWEERAIQDRAVALLIQRARREPEVAAVVGEGLRSRLASQRGTSATILGALGKAGEPYFSDLMALLSDSDSIVRVRAGEALYQLAGAAAPVLIAKLKERKDSRIATDVFRILSRFTWSVNSPRQAEAIEEAVAALASPDVGLRDAAENFLVKQGRAAGPALTAAFCDPDDALHQGAAETLVKMGTQGALVIVDSLARSEAPHLPASATWAAERLPPVDALKVRDALRVRDVTQALADRTVPELVESLSDPQFVVAVRASTLLAEKKAAAVAPLTTALKDKREQVRRLAARSLGDIGEPARAAMEELIALGDDRSIDVRREAASAVGRLGPVVVDELKNRLAKPRSLADQLLVLRAAAEMETEGVDLIPSVLNVLKERDQRALVRETAVTALKQIASKSPEALAEALSDGNLELGRSLPGIFAVYGETGVAPLLPLLRNPNPHVRAAAASALGAIGKPAASAVSELDPLTRDTDDSVRYYSTEAIKKINKP